MSSPYPWHYTIRWPFYYNWPSMRNHTQLQPAPDQRIFSYATTETLKLLFCGDIMVQNHDAIPTLSPELCDLIINADLFIGNCEAPVGEHLQNPLAKYKFIFHMPQSYLENIIQQTGLPAEQWILSTANNHSGDIDFAAYLKTQTILTAIGVTPIGRYVEAKPPITIVEKKGLRLGFIAWTQWMNREIFSTLDPGAYRTKHVCQYNWRLIKKQYGLNYIFGLPHWEFEFQHFPQYQTRELAKFLINTAGIDFVVGIHTHTLQSIEYFDHGLCLYSLGNFCGLGKAWSIKLIPLLEVNLNLSAGDCILNSYRLHYYYQYHQQKRVSIIPFTNAPVREQKRLNNRINKLYDRRWSQRDA